MNRNSIYRVNLKNIYIIADIYKGNYCKQVVIDVFFTVINCKQTVSARCVSVDASIRAVVVVDGSDRTAALLQSKPTDVWTSLTCLG